MKLSDEVVTMFMGDMIVPSGARWAAFPSSYEPGDFVGWGMTETDAVDDLLEQVEFGIWWIQSVNRQSALL